MGSEEKGREWNEIEQHYREGGGVDMGKWESCEMKRNSKWHVCSPTFFFLLFWRSQGLLGRDRSSIPYGAIDLSSRVFLAIGERLIRRTPLNVEISGLTEPGLEPLNSWLRD